MICLRSGYCCKTMMVVIVDDPAKGLIESNLKFHDGTSPCQHLLGDQPGEYSCAIHDEEWYDQTPCFSHGQIEQTNSPYRLGNHILKNDKTVKQV